MRTFVATAVLIALQPQAALPQAAEAPAPVSVAAPPVAGDRVPAQTPAPAPAQPAAPDKADPVILRIALPAPSSDFRVPAKYRPKTTGLETVYCRTYTPTGTRMRKTDCYTLAQVEQIERQAAMDRREHREKTGTCSGSCGG